MDLPGWVFHLRLELCLNFHIWLIDVMLAEFLLSFWKKKKGKRNKNMGENVIITLYDVNPFKQGLV